MKILKLVKFFFNFCVLLSTLILAGFPYHLKDKNLKLVHMYCTSEILFFSSCVCFYKSYILSTCESFLLKRNQSIQNNRFDSSSLLCSSSCRHQNTWIFFPKMKPIEFGVKDNTNFTFWLISLISVNGLGARPCLFHFNENKALHYTHLFILAYSLFKRSNKFLST